MTKVEPTVYMDESGDLGFDFANFKKVEVKNHHGTLHCYKEKPTMRLRLLNALVRSDSTVLTLTLDKSKVYTRLHDEKHVLYNYIVNILLDRMISKKLVPLDTPIRFVASRRETSKFLNENFTNYLNSQVKNNHRLQITTDIIKPSEEKGLQVVDFVAWSYFRKYEHGDSSYADVLRDITVEEGRLFG